jgi:hypothetical protein
MNRSVVWLGIAVALVGVALMGFPIAVTGHEVFDLEQESGFLVAPVGLLVVMFGATFADPTLTTVGGAFGNPEAEPPSAEARGPVRPPVLAYHPKDSSSCRFCRTYIEYSAANCPRCGRARDCRTCTRPLGLVLDRATCPLCARPEAMCNCPRLASPIRPATGPRPVRRGYG